MARDGMGGGGGVTIRRESFQSMKLRTPVATTNPASTCYELMEGGWSKIKFGIGIALLLLLLIVYVCVCVQQQQKQLSTFVCPSGAPI